MKKNTISANALKGQQALTYIAEKNNALTERKATTADVAVGDLDFPAKKADWEVIAREWVGRDGKTRDYPCVGCKDSAGDEHWIALSAFRAKEPIVTATETIQCDNLCEFDADYQTIWNDLQSAKKVTIHRAVGKRDGRKGRYEYFTFEK